MIFAEKILIKSRYPEHITTGQDLFDWIEQVAEYYQEVLSKTIFGVFVYHRQHTEIDVVCEVEKGKFVSYGYVCTDDCSYPTQRDLPKDWQEKEFKIASYSYSSQIQLCTTDLTSDTIIVLTD